MISLKLRKGVYAAIAILGLVMTCLQVAFDKIGAQPLWLQIAQAVYAVLAGNAGVLALMHAFEVNFGGDGTANVQMNADKVEVKTDDFDAADGSALHGA